MPSLSKKYTCRAKSCSYQWRRTPGACPRCGEDLTASDWLVRVGNRTQTVKGSQARARNVAQKDPQTNRTFGGAVNKYLKLRKTSTADVERKFWELHLEGFFSKRKVAALTRNALLEYVQQRRGEDNHWGGKTKDGTIAREIAIIRQITKHLGCYNSQTFEGLGLKKGGDEIYKYLTPDEQAELWDALPMPSNPYYQFLHMTGARKQEALLLEWSQIVWAKSYCRVYGKTADKWQTMYLSDKALALLDGMPKTHKKVFLNRYSEPLTAPREQLLATVRGIGLNKRLEASGRDPINGVHYLRHSAISNWVMAGIDLAVVAKLARHKNLQMTMRYTHLAPDHILSALNRV